MTSSTRPHQSGFVLVGVIWVLASMALLAAFISDQLQSLQQQAFAMEVEKTAVLDRMAIESGLLYLAATRTVSFAGIRTEPFEQGSMSDLEMIGSNFFAPTGSELRMDSRVYEVRGEHKLALQDAGSLVSLRADPYNKLRRLLAGYELSPAEVDRLISTLADYVDRDNLPRLNGAEKNDYERKKMLPPTNRFLVNPRQLYNVMDWQPVLDRHPDLLNELTIYVGESENFNTMTVKALGGYDPDGAGEQEAHRLSEHRKDDVFMSLADVLSVTGGVYQRDPMSLSLVPSVYIRARLIEPDNEKTHWIGITLTPDSNLAPWEVDYRLVLDTQTDTPKQEGTRAQALDTTAAPTSLLR